MNDQTTEVVMSDETALTTASIGQAVSTILANDTDDLLGELAKKIAAFEPDVTSAVGRKAIASMAHEVARTKMDLVRLGKSLTEGWRTQTKAVNAECSILEERMDALKAQVRKPLTDFEDREKRRVDAHAEAIERLRHIDPALERATAAEITLVIAARMEPEARDWEEFRERAVHEHAVALRTLRQWRIAAEVREDADREAARLAEVKRAEEARLQAEREEQIRIEAAEKAKREAEEAAAAAAAAEARRVEDEKQAIIDNAAQVAKEAQEAAERHAAAMQREIERREQAALEAEARAEKAERDRVAAAEAAERDRALAEKQAERDRLAAVAAERDRVAQEEERMREAARAREANFAHRRQINNAVRDGVLAVVAAIMPDDPIATQIATEVVIAIAKGEVKHVAISY